GAGEVVWGAAMPALMHPRGRGSVRELGTLSGARGGRGGAPPLDGAPAGPAGRAGVADLPYKEARAQVLHDFEASYLRALLERTEGNVSQAAREARMDRSHLIDLLQRHKLKSPTG